MPDANTDRDPNRTQASNPPADPGATVSASHARTATYTPAGMMPDVGGSLGRYRIDRKLGEGGMGTVYLAHDTTLDRTVALKIPKFVGSAEVAAERFLREARAAASFQHPNICPIYDVGEIGGTHFMAMAFVSGELLSAHAGRGRQMDPPEAARVVRQVALTMQAAHDHGVIHRDLKPANVMIDARGKPVVMDFGLARRDAGDRQLTVQGDVMGTPAYMPPEQIAGDVAKMGPASDVYALGGVLYELLTGAPPFSGDLLSLVTQITTEAPKPPSARRPGLDPRFDSVCLKALAKRPEERWKSMRAMADALAPLESGARTTASPAEGPTITLRVAGTNFAYQPPAVLSAVSVGRQKRKPGEAADAGNDFVLRVAGNDALSARISRRHFELTRTATGWAITDRSKVGVTRNGAPLPKDDAVPLSDGDTLSVAGVVALEVSIRSASDTGVKYVAVVAAPVPPSAGGGQLQIEASVGDVITLD